MTTRNQHADRMPHIQIKNVPPELHQALRDRAASAGKTLSDFLTDELWAVARYPGNAAVFEAILSRPPLFDLQPGDAADLIREGREERWSS